MKIPTNQEISDRISQIENPYPISYFDWEQGYRRGAAGLPPLADRSRPYLAGIKAGEKWLQSIQPLTLN